jgi:hypothetical protein
MLANFLPNIFDLADACVGVTEEPIGSVGGIYVDR